MRLGALFLILIAVMFGSGYWYRALSGVCDIPVAYRIGDIDERFSTSREELARIAKSAEDLWEKELGTELFVYDENATFPINLVFDERQENATIEAELREDLEAKEGMSAEFAAQYDVLIAEFRKLKKDYEGRISAYEDRLSAYNRTVEEWNNRGGAPEATIAELRAEEAALKREQEALESLTERLNRLVSQLNALGAKANTLIRNYNNAVEEYNDRVEEHGEFTQGDYTRDAITVYQFNSEEELMLVLAHEFGHALSLDHVSNEKSVMYHFMEAQSGEEGITEEDITEFNRICNTKPSFWAWVRSLKDLL